MVPPLRFELRLVGLRVRYAALTSRRVDPYLLILRANPRPYGELGDTNVYLNVSYQSFLIKKYNTKKIITTTTIAMVISLFVGTA